MRGGAQSIARALLLQVLSRFKHKHIIRLLGYTDNGGGGAAAQLQHCLLYEFGHNGALSDALEGDATAAALTWQLRLRVAAGVADALNYLHRAEAAPALHMDVKAANVARAAAATSPAC